MKKTITIKNALLTDKEYLDKLATGPAGSVAQALHDVITLAQTAINPQDAEQTKKDYEQETANLQESVLQLNRDNAELQRKLSEQTELTVTETGKQKSLQDRITELETELETAKAQPKGVVLNGFQFICELDEKTSINARKIRPFMKKQGFYEPVENETPAQYINSLVSVAIPFFMRKNFIDYID